MNIRLTILALALLPALALAQAAPPCFSGSGICGPAPIPPAMQQAQAQNWQHLQAIEQQAQAPIAQAQQGLNQFEQQQTQQSQAWAEQEQANTQWQEMMDSEPDVPSWAQNYEAPPSTGDWEELDSENAELDNLESENADLNSENAELNRLAKASTLNQRAFGRDREATTKILADLAALRRKEIRFEASCPQAPNGAPAGSSAHVRACVAMAQAIVKRYAIDEARATKNEAARAEDHATAAKIYARLEALPH